MMRIQVSCKDLPGIVGEGSNLDDALDELADELYKKGAIAVSIGEPFDDHSLTVIVAGRPGNGEFLFDIKEVT